MCDWQRLKEVSTPTARLNENAEKMASLKLARRYIFYNFIIHTPIFNRPFIISYFIYQIIDMYVGFYGYSSECIIDRKIF